MPEAKTTATSLLKTLQAMSEIELQRHVVVPLLRAMFPDGRVEETSGPNEAGRDIICITKHARLERPYITCVQLKNKKISSGSAPGTNSLMAIKAQVEEAKRTGVLGPSAEHYVPNEVWVINTYPTSDNFRRKAGTALKLIADLSGHFIDGTELETSLQRYCPSLVAELVGVSTPTIGLIATLSAHKESRAFGLRLDRNINDFYVQARLVPGSTLAGQFLSGVIEVSDRNIFVGLAMTRGEFERSQKGGDEIFPADMQDRSIAVLQEAATRFGVRITWTMELHENENKPGAHSNQFMPVQRIYDFAFASAATKRRIALTKDLNRLPALLSEDRAAVRKSLEAITETERFLRECRELNIILRRDEDGAGRRQVTVKSVKVGDELDILSLGHVVFIEARPGSGKTTLLKRIAIASLRASRPTFFIECSQLRGGGFFSEITEAANRKRQAEARASAGKRRELAEAIYIPLSDYEAFAQLTIEQRLEKFQSFLEVHCHATGMPESWKFRGSTVIIDGLDELEVELHSIMFEAVSSGFYGALGVVVSSREAYDSDLRYAASRIWLSQFSDRERDDFFVKWFRNDLDKHKRVTSLIRSYADIDENTRVPLIATLVGALVENDYEPTSRVEIYQHRLRLLLGDWDKVRGVSRSKIVPKYKFRYVRDLAISMHEQRRKLISADEALQVFSSSLGQKGYAIGFEALLDDLIKASGVILRDGSGLLSFGHLSFQEHLVGEYLSSDSDPKRIRQLLGNEWWKEALLFYAGIKGDVTELVNYCERIGVAAAHWKQLLGMARTAPFTSGVAIEVLLATGRELEG